MLSLSVVKNANFSHFAAVRGWSPRYCRYLVLVATILVIITLKRNSIVQNIQQTAMALRKSNENTYGKCNNLCHMAFLISFD